MSRTFGITAILASTIALGACAPKDVASNEPGAVALREFNEREIADRDLELSRHLVGQLNLARRQMEMVLTGYEFDRAGFPGDAVRSGQSCRIFIKGSPEPDRDYDTRHEQFRVRFNCAELGLPGTVGGSSFTGDEDYRVTWQGNLARKNSPTPAAPGFPEYATVDYDNARVALYVKGVPRDASPAVIRNGKLTIELVGQDATTLVYKLNYTGRDTLVFRWQGVERTTNANLRMRDTILKVNPANKEIFEMTPGELSVNAEYAIAAVGEEARSRKSAVTSVVLTADDRAEGGPQPFTAGANSCEPFAGSLKMTRTIGDHSSKPARLTIKDSQISTQSQGVSSSLPLKVCNEDEYFDPVTSTAQLAEALL